MNTLAPALDFRIFLEREFLRRCRKNKLYSLRSFASQLEIEASFLSKLIRGKQKITSKTIERIGQKIGINQLELSKYLDKSPLDPTKIYNQMPEDCFALLSDSMHFAIIELIKLPHCQKDYSWMAKTLESTAKEVEECVLRLERVGFLKGWQILAPTNTWSNFEHSTEARKNLQKSLLLKALESLDEVPFEKRQSASLTIACDKNLVPTIKQKIDDFIAHLDSYIENKGNENSVYQCCFSFFPLTKDIK
jgi:transcriptional regulator with XRE-family HTH domain